MSDHALEQVRRARPHAGSVAWPRAAWRQYRLERKMFWRNPSAAFFNFLLPLLFLALFGAIFAGDEDDLQVIVPGIAGMAVMSTTFSALAMTITYLRESGVLKRVRGTPLPTSAYLAGIAGNAVTNTALQVALIIGGGHARVRARPAAGLRGAVVFVALGVVCFASLGVALSHAIPNFDSAPAYVNAVFLPVIFISGVFYDADNAPGVPARDRGGAAAQAPDRRAVGGARQRRRAGRQPAGGARARALDGRGARARRARVQLGGAARRNVAEGEREVRAARLAGET